MPAPGKYRSAWPCAPAIAALIAIETNRMKAIPNTIASASRREPSSRRIMLRRGTARTSQIWFSAVIAGAQGHADQYFPGAGIALRVVYALVSFVIVTGVIAMLFKYVPDAVIDWRDVFIGALITGVLFTVGKYVLGVYLAHLRYSSAGAAGSLIMIVIWVYYSSLILFFGAEVTQVYARRFGKRIQPSEHAERVNGKP